MSPTLALAPLSVWVAWIAASAPGVPESVVEREAYVMGTRLRVVVMASDYPQGIAAIEAAFSEVRRWEGLLSSWRADSEMARVNSALPGRSLKVSAELVALLQEVDVWSRESRGAFDPAVGPLISAWGLRGRGRVPSASELDRALASSGVGAFQLDSAAGRVRRANREAWMTAGAFGKGAALRAARAALEAAGIRSATLDFGGQLLAMGSPLEGGARTFGVAHPSRRHEVAAVIHLSNRSAATSAASERFVEIDGARYGHILDPRSGWPVAAWGSVTVVAEDPMLADIASTTLFVMGPDEGMRWVEGRSDIGALFLRAGDGELRASWNPAMEPWLVTVEAESVTASAQEHSPR